MDSEQDGRKVKITSASKPELRAFAKQLGVNVANFLNEQQIIAKLRAQGWGEDHIVVVDEGGEPETAAPKAAAKKPTPSAKPAAPKKAVAAPPARVTTESLAAKPPKRVLTEPMVELTVTQQSGAGGSRPISVAVNGVNMLIPRGKKCSIKYRYYVALMNAVETGYELNEENDELEARDTHSYPFMVHKMPSDEEIAEWQAFEAEQDALKKRRAA